MHLCEMLNLKYNRKLILRANLPRNISVIWSLFHLNYYYYYFGDLCCWFFDFVISNDMLRIRDGFLPMTIFANQSLLTQIDARLFPNIIIHKPKSLTVLWNSKTTDSFFIQIIISSQDRYFLCLPFQFQFKESLFFCKYNFSAFFCGCCFVLLFFVQFFYFYFGFAGVY